MKAIAPLVALSLALAACVPAPTPAPAPPVVQPRPVQAAPPPLPAPVQDWRDAPQTPGTWVWAMSAGKSTAMFGRPGAPLMATLTCDRAQGRVLLARAGSATVATPMAVATTTQRRPLLNDPAISPPGWLVVAVAARDPLLDAMAFSRGRFALEAAGQETLYLPAWPEISRVIEDCR